MRYRANLFALFILGFYVYECNLYNCYFVTCKMILCSNTKIAAPKSHKRPLTTINKKYLPQYHKCL